MEEDAISHALGLNYGRISDCIIEYLPLRNHYHMLCINSGCGVSKGLMCGNANLKTFVPSSAAPKIDHAGPQVEVKNEYIYIGIVFTLDQEDQCVSEYKKRQMYHPTQAVLFATVAYCLRKANLRWQQVALEHRVSIHLRD